MISKINHKKTLKSYNKYNILNNMLYHKVTTLQAPTINLSQQAICVVKFNNGGT